MLLIKSSRLSKNIFDNVTRDCYLIPYFSRIITISNLIFNKNKKKGEWEINFLYPIWRISPNHQNCIITEVRNITEKIVSFHCVNATTGQLRWDNLQLSQKWWIGIEGIFGDVLILHEYERPDLPAHKKIIAIDLNTGKIIWSNDELVFISSDNYYILAKKITFNSTQYLKLNLLTGELICELDENEFRTTSEELKKQELIYYRIPLEYSIDQLPNVTVQKFVQLHNKKSDIVEPIEVFTYLENDLNVVGYSRNISNNISTPMYDEYIDVLGKNAKNIYSDKIVSGVNMPFIPKYFVKNNFLYYIKDKTILRGVKLF